MTPTDRGVSERAHLPEATGGLKMGPHDLPRYGQEECQDRKTVLNWRKRGDPITLHRECPSGHAWHFPLVISPGTQPAPCDCESEA